MVTWIRSKKSTADCLSTLVSATMLIYIVLTQCFGASMASEQECLAHNPCPCMHSEKSWAYEDFLRKHVRSDAPATLDQNQWQDFIRNISTCHRPVQSFLPFALKNLIDNVCSASGGKVYHGDLCISKQEFNFTTVYVDNNCIVRNVIPEKKYIILACDELQGYCHPVHFEANPRNEAPEYKSPDCKKPNCKNHTQLVHPTVGCLTLLMLSAALTHLISLS